MWETKERKCVKYLARMKKCGRECLKIYGKQFSRVFEIGSCALCGGGAMWTLNSDLKYVHLCALHFTKYVRSLVFWFTTVFKWLWERRNRMISKTSCDFSFHVLFIGVQMNRTLICSLPLYLEFHSRHSETGKEY